MSLKISAYMCIAILVQYVHGQSERCYFCNTEVHGQGCNDPIAPNDIQMQRCSDNEIVTNETYVSEVWDFFKSYNIFAEKPNVSARNTYPDVCISMTYQFESRNVSSRGCETDQRDTILGILDVCEYYSLIIPTGRILNFNCTICRGNLCNFESGTEGGSQTISMSLTLMVTIILTKMFFM